MKPTDLRIWKTENLFCPYCGKAIQAKVEITDLEQRIAELEKELLAEKAAGRPLPNAQQRHDTK